LKNGLIESKKSINLSAMTIKTFRTDSISDAEAYENVWEVSYRTSVFDYLSHGSPDGKRIAFNRMRTEVE
jgi:hypothetical protein